MKATIVEVYKDYCIAITEDGQFLKEKTPAGIYEIGDEIVIAQPVVEKAGERTRVFQIVSRTAIGFAAVAVIIIGSYFGVQYIRTGTTSTDLAMAPEEKAQMVRSAAAEDTGESFEGEGEAGEITVETVMADEAAGEEPVTEEAMAFEADEEVEEAADEEVDEAADEEVEEATDEIEEAVEKSATEIMREYANQIATPAGGDTGANAKSVVASKNDMGGTAANIVAGDTEAGVEANKGNLKGAALSDQNAKEDNAGNRNTPGGTSAKSGMKNEPGHGAEKKGKPEQAANKKSTIGS